MIRFNAARTVMNCIKIMIWFAHFSCYCIARLHAVASYISVTDLLGHMEAPWSILGHMKHTAYINGKP